MYRQTPHKSPHEVSRTRRVLLGTAAQLAGVLWKLENFTESLFVDV
jgi:hypothetical protein